MYDVIIVGGGPAGLSGALLLARYNRKIVVFDTNQPRNLATKTMHGFITRDGVLPTDFIKMAKKELESYGVDVINEEIVDVKKLSKKYVCISKDNKQYESKLILIATGLRDRLPPIKHIENFYGTSVFHCPYCDGYESNGKNIAVYGKGKKGVDHALGLIPFSSKITLYTNGKQLNRKKHAALLEKNNIHLVTDKIDSVAGADGALTHVVLKENRRLRCDVLFFSSNTFQHSKILKKLNCYFISKGVVCVDKFQRTNILGLYVAGDAAREMQMVVVAAAEGVKAAVSINRSLLKREIKK